MAKTLALKLLAPLTAGLLLAGCGGQVSKAPTPHPSVSQTQEATPTATPTPTPTPEAPGTPVELKGFHFEVPAGFDHIERAENGLSVKFQRTLPDGMVEYFAFMPLQWAKPLNAKWVVDHLGEILGSGTVVGSSSPASQAEAGGLEAYHVPFRDSGDDTIKPYVVVYEGTPYQPAGKSATLMLIVQREPGHEADNDPQMLALFKAAQKSVVKGVS